MPGEKELQDSTISSTSDPPGAAASESRDCNNKVLQSNRVTSTNTCRMSQRLKQALRKRFRENNS